MHTRPLQMVETGFALIQALIAMAVLAVGLSALAGVHLRTLQAAQSSTYRLHAIRLIEDLAERLRAHPQASAVRHLVLTPGWMQGDALAHLPDCDQSSCTAEQFASATRTQWLHHVAASLPLGQAHIFATADAQHLGVMVAWRNPASLLPTSIEPADPELTCPHERACHLQYIHIGANCLAISSNTCAGS